MISAGGYLNKGRVGSTHPSLAARTMITQKFAKKIFSSYVAIVTTGNWMGATKLSDYI